MDALGMIETKGLIGTVEALDSMLKAADVSLVDRVFVGSGIVTVTIQGDVGAVKAAVDAGAAAVSALSPELLLSEHVIPRPDASLDGIVVTRIASDSSNDGPDGEGPDPEPGGGDAPENGSAESGNISAEIETVSKIETAQQESELVVPAEEKSERAESSEETDQTETEKTEEASETASDDSEAAEETDEVEEKTDAEESSENDVPDEVTEAADESEGGKPEEESEEEQAEPETSEAEESISEKAQGNTPVPASDGGDDIARTVAESGVDALDDMLSGYRVSELRKLARGYKGFSLSGRDISKANKKMLIDAIKEYYK